MNKGIVVVGGAGNVGSGIVKAFNKRGWNCKIIDPKVNKTFESLSNQELNIYFSSVSNVVYAVEIGNRDLYTKKPRLGSENKKRFSNFCNKIQKINPDITIWYVGGSWTKRQPNINWLVNDSSSNKKLSVCNPYEKAKISAEKNARRFSKKIKIRFLDWASIVPNMSDNFSVPKMVVQALNEGKITYSPGPYGRPLLENLQAGEALIQLIEKDSNKIRFSKILIPGVFIPFEAFAKTVKDVVEKETSKKIRLEKQINTPDFLKAQTQSKYLEKLGFIPDKRRVLGALRENALQYIKKFHGSQHNN